MPPLTEAQKAAFKAELSALCREMDQASADHSVVMERTKREAHASRAVWLKANKQFRIAFADLQRREAHASRT